jgi:DNA helicase II / ATP-dependent DNA helicase PcrA
MAALRWAGMTPAAAASQTPIWAEGLDDDQLCVAEHDGGPLLIVAGAGTGKTRTLVARLACLIDRGVSPDRILLVTFSRRAADEMIRRLAPLVGAERARQIPAGTFHAMAHRLLHRHATSLGLGDGFSVIDQSDALDLMQLTRQEVIAEAASPTPPDRRRRFPRRDTLGSIYSRVVNSQVGLGEVLHRHFPWVEDQEMAISSVFSAYTARKRSRRLLDFDDLLLYWRAAALDAVVGKELAEAYDHVLVDEYQDTNLLQADIVASLASGGCSLTVVGDDAQAIYAFRAATGRNMLDFPARFPGTAMVALEHNYRSTQPILDLANFVLAAASEGYAKRLWTATAGGTRPVLLTCPDEGAQAEAVADLILDHHEAGGSLRQQAVLFRSAHHSDLLEVELHRRGIPYVKYGGLRFLEAAHVRDLVAALRILDNPHDELAWYRILQLLDGVGPARARTAMTDLGLEVTPGGPAPRSRRPVGPDGPLSRFLAGGCPLPAKAAADASALAAAFRQCGPDGPSPAVQIDRLREALDPLVRRRYDKAEIRLRDLDALARLASGFRDRAGLVADLTIDPPLSTGDLAGPPLLDDDYVTLSTVHSAKGAEWRVVHLIHAADGMFPSDLATGSREEIEEERRLFYVALTRAQEHLYMYAPLRYHHSGSFGRGDAHGYAQRTRFLPPAANDLLEHRPVRARGADSAGGMGAGTGAADLASSVDECLRGLW